MSSSLLKIRPGVPSDIRCMCDTFLDAFSGNMVGRTFFPRASDSAHKFWIDALNEEIHDPNARFIVVEDTSTSPPTFIAFAKWVVPLPSGAPQPVLPEDWPEDGDPALAKVFFKKLADMHVEVMADRPHWYLELIATKQEYQGRGAGGLLMRWGVDRADEEGVECYLDATPEGISLYGKFGFRDEVTWSFFDETYLHSFMVRKAKETDENGP
ncbi:hypothetical protein VP1G_02091 [Cytospora mali]|uniref:N-acetyltransferase domain-containing protein n=1 Tax=Cytospora mali TaxID=578113 RepID=A0A194USY5_CYTMA|nr:hypothetical protein VP1G_02091 [Valsa mali var. pyri (nom. inval.)]